MRKERKVVLTYTASRAVPASSFSAVLEELASPNGTREQKITVGCHFKILGTSKAAEPSVP